MEDNFLIESIDFEKRQAVFIFAESIIKEIHSARQSCLEAVNVRKTKYNINIFEDPFCCTCNGKILALDGLEKFIEQLLDFYK